MRALDFMLFSSLLHYAYSVSTVNYCKDYSSLADSIRGLASLVLDDTNNKTRCCDLIGCFSNEKGAKYEKWLYLPSCLDQISPEFFIYTSDNPTVNQTVDIFNLDSSVDKLKISKDKELFVIIHGWKTTFNQHAFMFPMKDALINQGHNAMIVKWTNGSDDQYYLKSAANTQSVGLAVAMVLKKMVQKGKADLNSSTIIGFSLGAQTAGFAGANLTNLKRIIGLDPAGPMFDCENKDIRLSPDDAKFVQVLHTSAAGSRIEMGHVDFYANFLIQPGCEDIDTKKKTFSVTDIFNYTQCSHGRAYTIFTEIINNSKKDKTACKFSGYPCNESKIFHDGGCFVCPPEGCPTPGLHLDYGTSYSGNYYFNTQSDAADDICGRPFRVTLQADHDVDGRIDLMFSGSGGHTVSSTFILTEKIDKNRPKRRIVMAPWSWSLNNINQITLNYTRSSGILWGLLGGGTDLFKVTNASVEDASGNIKTLCSPVNFVTGSPASINLSPCN